jgi:hypothetical protein
MATQAENEIWEWVTKNLDFDGFMRMKNFFAPVEDEDE